MSSEQSGQNYFRRTMFLIIQIYQDRTEHYKFVTSVNLTDLNNRNITIINVDSLKRFDPDTGKWTDVELV